MNDFSTKFGALEACLDHAQLRPRFGRLVEVSGPIIKARFAGVPHGAICEIDCGAAPPLLAEVIGIVEATLVLSPFGNTSGLTAGARVRVTAGKLTIPAGDGLLGRVVDTFGVPLDGLGPLDPAILRRPIKSSGPDPMDRPMIDAVLPTGLRAIDGPLTLGRGQRVGVFGPPGTGKSSLLAAIARHTAADVVVVGLIGERGREVREFVERELPASARGKVVIVCATSDRPAVERALCAHSATAVAEGFRDQGKSVLLLIDSLSRTARALREVGLAAGEAPTRRGFPASVYPALPAIIERAGRHKLGDITALYTVLTEGDGQNDPIAEEVKSLTDGHFILSQHLAEKGHFPALDPLESLSRSMNAIVTSTHRTAATDLRQNLAKYRDIEVLIQVGEYRAGGDKAADKAVATKPRIDAFLRQSSDQSAPFAKVVRELSAAVR